MNASDKTTSYAATGTAGDDPAGEGRLLATALHGALRPHAHSFPPSPPGGLALDPGPCACGKTYPQGRADELLASAAAAAAAAYPLPDAVFLNGISGACHAIRRADAEWMTRRHGNDPAVPAACGQLARIAWAWPAYGEDSPLSGTPCPECAWIVAGEDGDLDRQVQALIPSAADLAVLERLMPDPMIAVTAAAMLTEAATSGHADDEFDHPATIQLLATITRHAPVILVPEDCAEGTCGHCPGGYDAGSAQAGQCPCPDAAVACAECSLQAGPWAGEWQGQYRGECTIAAPCQVLAALAAHAEKALAQAVARQAATGWEASRPAGGAGQPWTP